MSSIAGTVTVVSEDSSLLQQIAWSLEGVLCDVQPHQRFDPLVAAWSTNTPEFLLVDYDHSDLATASKLPHLTDRGFCYKILLADPAKSLDRVAELELSFNDVVAKPIRVGELLARLAAGAAYARHEQELREQALCDRCTGLLSRQGLYHTLRAAGAVDSSLGTIVLSLDFLESFARRFGAAGCDQLLCEAAERIEAALPEDAWLARIGPQTFAVVWVEAPQHELELAADQVRRRLDTGKFEVRGEVVRLTATSVISNAPGGIDELPDRLTEAEQNLQLAKSLGGATVSWCGQLDDAYEKHLANRRDQSAEHDATALDLMVPFATTIHAQLGEDAAWHALRASTAPLAPVVDQTGNYAGIVRRHVWQQGAEIGWEAEIETPPEVEGRTNRFELAELLTDEPSGLLVIIRDRQPLGYVTAEHLAIPCISA